MTEDRDGKPGVPDHVSADRDAYVAGRDIKDTATMPAAQQEPGHIAAIAVTPPPGN